MNIHVRTYTTSIMCARPLFFSLTLSTLLITASITTAVETTTEPVGAMLMKVNSPASPGTSRLSLISATFVNPVSYQGAIATLNATTLTVAGTPWAANQFNGANGKYYIEITSGAGAGAMSDITATATNSLTLTDNLTTFGGATTAFRIRKHVTIGQIFGATNTAGLLAGQSPSEADEIIVLDAAGQSFATYFYGDFDGTEFDGWYDASYTAAANAVITPEQGIIIRRKQTGAQLQFVFSGSVKPGQTLVPVSQGVNYVGMANAAGRTLATSGLFTGSTTTGVKSGQGLGDADEIALIGSDGAFNVYWYGDFDGTEFDGWYDSSYNPSNSLTINPGTGIFIRRKAPSSSFNWTVPSAY
ncbi:MAG: TIGR02597 family protein [Verrucomicrobiota bacterium]|nr:TIGR02597 family protein [Verrucomicrobiota bacterium]